MKRNDIIITISLIIYSILFYKQSAGINFTIFSVVLAFFLYSRDNTVIKNPRWVASAVGSIASGIAVMLIGSPLAIIANICSLSLMSAFSISRKSSVIFGLFYAAISYVTSIAFVIVDMIEKKPRQKTKTQVSSQFWTKFLIYLGIAVVVVIFFMLYRQSNVVFKEFTKDINLDFITWGWILFMFMGFLILYGFFIHRNIPGLYKKEERVSDNLDQEKSINKTSRLFGKSISISAEHTSGMVLFILLNILIFMVNVLDISYLWSGSELPEGLTYADLVHQAIGNLIFSIIIAIITILFYFRSRLNFYKKSKSLKIVAYAWVIQNIFILASTAYRNQLYIQEYNLTHKRIGVYVYLLLALIGLVTTFIKIMQNKSNWYLYRKNGWAFYAVLVIAAFFNWDMIITRYNMNYSKDLDKYYLLQLSYVNIPALIQLDKDTSDFEEQYVNYSNYNRRGLLNYIGEDRKNYVPRLHYKLYDFLDHMEGITWKSWCLNKTRTLRQIKELEETGRLDTLYLKNNSINTTKPISYLNGIHYLDLQNNYVQNFSGLEKLNKLKYLDLTSNSIDSLGKLPSIESLQSLLLQNNKIMDLDSLVNFPNLEYLNIAYNRNVLLKSLPNDLKIKRLDLSGDHIKNYSYLEKLKMLEVLEVRSMQNRDISTFPALENLRFIDLASNSINNYDSPLFKKLAQYKSLESINLNNNKISNLLLLTETVLKKEKYWRSNSDRDPLFPKLERLEIANNKIYQANILSRYKTLHYLSLSDNEIDGIENFRELTQLKTLLVNGCSLDEVQGLEAFEQLAVLDASNNKIEDISEMKALRYLKKLRISNNKIKKCEVLSNLNHLEELNISQNSIEDISSLSGLTQLRKLNISYNAIDDYTPLYSLKNLKELYVTINDKKALEKLKEQLPNTTINELSASY